VTLNKIISYTIMCI